MDKEILDVVGELLFKGLVVVAIIQGGRLHSQVQSLKQEVLRLKDDVKSKSPQV